MDSYHFSRVTGRPASQPLPESHTGDHLPQMSTYSGSSQSRNTSVPQPINYGGRASGYNGVSQSRRTNTPQIESRGSVSVDNGTTQSRGTSLPDARIRYTITPSEYSDFGMVPSKSVVDWWNQKQLDGIESRGSVSGYNGVSQSRTTNVSQPISGGGTYSGTTQSRYTSGSYSGTTQSRRTNAPQIEYSSTLRNGRTTGSGSGALQRAEPKGRVLNAMHNFVHCERRGRNYDSLREAANNRGWDSNKTWHFKPAGEALSDLGLDVDYHDSQPDSWSKFPDKAIVGVKEDGQARAVYLNGDYIYDGNALEPHHRNAYAISDESSFLEIKSKR